MVQLHGFLLTLAENAFLGAHDPVDKPAVADFVTQDAFAQILHVLQYAEPHDVPVLAAPSAVKESWAVDEISAPM